MRMGAPDPLAPASGSGAITAWAAPPIHSAATEMPATTAPRANFSNILITPGKKKNRVRRNAVQRDHGCFIYQLPAAFDVVHKIFSLTA